MPNVQFEGKGLWATEGVVTIPYNDQYPLAYQSHFYEFEYLEGEKQGQIVPSWQLKQGDVVSPLITSGNGLLRYCLDDCLKVTGFLEQIPCFEFQGRRFGVDLVGEKLAPETAQQLLSQLNETESKAISLLAIDTQQQVKPFYCVLLKATFITVLTMNISTVSYVKTSIMNLHETWGSSISLKFVKLIMAGMRTRN